MNAMAFRLLAALAGASLLSLTLPACASHRDEPVGKDDAKLTVLQDGDQLYFCPKDPVTRRDMARFLERMKNGRDFDPPAARGIFDDVPHGTADERWIEALAGDRITRGCGQDGKYCPDDGVPREQMAAFIMRLQHGPDFTRDSPSRFVDLTGDSAQFAGYVEQLADDGITTGCDETHFCPKDIVNREQMATFLMRARHPGADPVATSRFADVKADSQFTGRIEQAVSEGIMEPCGVEKASLPSVLLKESASGGGGEAVCKFLCDSLAFVACGAVTENPQLATICGIAANELVCAPQCEAENWQQVCVVTDPEQGCTVCCQSIYGCGPEQCAYPKAW